MSVTALPHCLDHVGAGRFRWYCWHCRRSSMRPVAGQRRAIRRLDQHVQHWHRRVNAAQH